MCFVSESIRRSLSLVSQRAMLHIFRLSMSMSLVGPSLITRAIFEYHSAESYSVQKVDRVFCYSIREKQRKYRESRVMIFEDSQSRIVSLYATDL